MSALYLDTLLNRDINSEQTTQRYDYMTTQLYD